MWTVVAVTCPTASWCRPLESWLQRLVELDQSLAETVLVVPDPGDGVGSGGATLNALLGVTEHLSARQGHTTVVPELLTSARVLIVHLGPALLPYPTGLLYVSEGAFLPDTTLPTTNLQRTIGLATGLSSGPGVVVASADILLSGRLQLDPGWTLQGDIQVLTVTAEAGYASLHGVTVVDKEGFVANILYLSLIHI